MGCENDGGIENEDAENEGCLTYFADRNSRTDFLQAIHGIVFHAGQVSIMSYKGCWPREVACKGVILINSGMCFASHHRVREVNLRGELMSR